MNLPHIYLASRSPRRRQMLEMVGIKSTLLDGGVRDRFISFDTGVNLVPRIGVDVEPF